MTAAFRTLKELDLIWEKRCGRGDLRQLEVFSLKEKLDAFVLNLKPEDANVVELLEQGLKEGGLAIPGAVPGQPDGFDGLENVTGYLNAFGATVAQRIREQFKPLFDPATEPLSEEVLAVNGAIQAQAGYSLYDAQLAVAGIIEGNLSEEGLAAMSDVRDLTSQMAKELTLGIKDNVEDIAAAFKKMAVINPERRARIAAQPAVELPAPEERTIRTESARIQRKTYDGLLERTLEERKKKKKKPVVDEDQFSIAGFAA